MRFHLLTAVLMASVALPAAAQKSVPVDRRVDRLEQEMRAVQRRVFPGGNVEPEIRPVQAPPAMAGVPAGSPVADLTARVDALEAQLASLTGQIEQNGFRVRQVEEAMSRFQADTAARLAAVEARGVPAQPAAQLQAEPVADEPRQTSEAPPAPGGAATPAAAGAGDPGEAAYNAGFRLWEQKRYAEAQAALEAMAKQYPRHAKASWARNLAGRAMLDDGKPAAAAKIFLNNYQTNPKGERAPDSLLYLGEALTKLGKNAEACQVYGELQDVYGPTLRAPLRPQLARARTTAKCGS
jgi:TolA-binding protein